MRDENTVAQGAKRPPQRPRPVVKTQSITFRAEPEHRELLEAIAAAQGHHNLSVAVRSLLGASLGILMRDVSRDMVRLHNHDTRVADALADITPQINELSVQARKLGSHINKVIRAASLAGTTADVSITDAAAQLSTMNNRIEELARRVHEVSLS